MSGSAKLKRIDERRLPRLKLGDRVRITTPLRKIGTIVDIKKTEQGPSYLVAVTPVRVELPTHANAYLITEIIP